MKLKHLLPIIAGFTAALIPQKAIPFSKPTGIMVQEGTLSKGNYRIQILKTDKTSSFEPAKERVKFEWEDKNKIDWQNYTYVGTVDNAEVERIMKNLEKSFKAAEYILNFMGVDFSTEETWNKLKEKSKQSNQQIERWDIYRYNGKHTGNLLNLSIVPSNIPEIKAEQKGRTLEFTIEDNNKYDETISSKSYLPSINTNDLTTFLGSSLQNDLEYIVTKVVDGKETIIDKGIHQITGQLIVKYDLTNSTASHIKINLKDEVSNENYLEVELTPTETKKPKSDREEIELLVKKWFNAINNKDPDTLVAMHFTEIPDFRQVKEEYTWIEKNIRGKYSLITDENAYITIKDIDTWFMKENCLEDLIKNCKRKPQNLIEKIVIPNISDKSTVFVSTEWYFKNQNKKQLEKSEFWFIQYKDNWYLQTPYAIAAYEDDYTQNWWEEKRKQCYTRAN